MARLQDFYKETVVPALTEKFGYKSIMEVPRLTKITLNMGVSEAVADKKVMDHAVGDLTKTDDQGAGFAAQIKNGLIYPLAAQAQGALALFNPYDAAISRSATDLVLPAYLADARPELRPLLLTTLRQVVTDPSERAMVEGLAKWDGDHRIGDIVSTVFNQFLYELAKAAFADELGEAQFKNLLRTRVLDFALPRLAAEPDDHEARLELAKALAGTGRLQDAADHLLAIIARDRTWNDDAARKQLLTVFEAAGPTSEVAKQGRRKLSSILFS